MFTCLLPFVRPSLSALSFFFPEDTQQREPFLEVPLQTLARCSRLTFLHASLRGRQHLVHSEGVCSLFDALVLHLLDVRQAVHGTAEVCLPRLGVWASDARLVFAYTHAHTHTQQRTYARRKGKAISKSNTFVKFLSLINVMLLFSIILYMHYSNREIENINSVQYF